MYFYASRSHPVDGDKSDMMTVKCGVPQGSILGPLLFIIYINDIVEVSDILTMILFADDTNIFISGKNINDLINTINAELCKLSRWFKLNKLSLNINKTHFMIFRHRTKNLHDFPDILIDNRKIDMVKSSKFLGVIINDSLTWTDHINLVKNKVSKSMGIIRHIKNRLPLSVLKMLYNSLINPYYDYCNLIWGTDSETNVSMKNLLLTQKRAVRIISNSKWNSHTEPLFKKLRILRLGQLHRLQVACFMYKVNHSLVSEYFLNMFSANDTIHSHNTRQRTHYHIVYCRTAHMKSTIRIAGPKLWNSIDQDIQASSGIHQFRSRYKLLLLNQ
jgi:hypothetical protein